MMDDADRLADRICEVTGWTTVGRPKIITDTTDWIHIERGDVLRLGGRDFVVKGYKYESRFGIDDQPKYWVLSAVDLESGEPKIIKTVFHEEFYVHIGLFKIHCYRSPEKEAKVLDLVRGDQRFMQGYTVLDDKKNHVRVIDLIKGETIFQYIYRINIMNLGKMSPYLPPKLSDVLLHFTVRPRAFYRTMTELLTDYTEMLDSAFPTN